MIRRVGASDERGAGSLLERLRRFISSLDKINLLTVLFLSATGLVFIYSTGIQAGYGAFFFRRQLIWLAVGFAAYLLCATPDPERQGYRVAAVIFYFGSLILLGAVLIPGIGIRVYGATRWIGFGALRIQPSEFAKMALILALAAVFSSREFKIDRWSGILTGGVITALPFALIVVEPDLGSALVCIPIFLVALFCAGLKWRWIVVGALAVLCICGAAVLNETMRIKPLLSNYQRNRILTFLDPERDRAGSGYNAYQAKLAVGSGGLTGKGIGWGGSLIRPEATGYGAIYFVQEMLARRNDSIAGKTVVISGYGNVAWGVAKKASELGARVVTISGSKGYIHCEGGLTGEMIAFMLELREKGLDLSTFADKFPGCKFYAGRRPWEVKADIAMPCATQNEVNGEDAAKLVANKVMLVAEGSNMGCLPEAAACFQRNGVLFAPGKAVNAGGVATSCLEMSQNAGHTNWTSAEVDHRLHDIMVHIHAACVECGSRKDGTVDYIAGANIAGFKRVADAMVAQGI